MRIFFCLALLVLAAGDLRAETPLENDTLPSPYFIDGIHCEGLRVRNPPTLFMPAEQVDTVRHIEAQEDCEKTAAIFGMQKFMWLTPEDLERFSNALRQSGNYEDVDVSIRKSELRNHIHVFIKVKPASSHHFSVGDSIEVQGGQGPGARITNRLFGEYDDRRYDPLITRNYGFSLEGSYAATPLVSSPVSPSNYYYDDLYLGFRSTYSKTFSSVIDIHLLPNNLDATGEVRVDSMAHGDLIYTESLFNYYLTVQFAASGIFATNATTPEGYASTFYPGFKVHLLMGKEVWDYLKMDVSFYHALGINSAVSDVSLYGQKHVCFLFENAYFDAGYFVHEAHHSFLPRDQYLFPDSTRSDIYLGLGKSFVHAPTFQQISAQVGAQEWQQNDGPFDGKSAYVGIVYTLASENWDIKIQATYYFQRMY